MVKQTATHIDAQYPEVSIGDADSDPPPTIQI